MDCKKIFSYVDDSVVPFWNASQNENCVGEIINLGGIKDIQLMMPVNILINVTGKNLKPLYLEARHETKSLNMAKVN